MERRHPDRLRNGKLGMRKGGRQTRLTSSIECVFVCVCVSEWENIFTVCPRSVALPSSTEEQPLMSAAHTEVRLRLPNAARKHTFQSG